jgi:ORF6N domain
MSAKRLARVLEPAIHTVRGQRVMRDSDLAKIYEVSTKRLNQQLRRNRTRFPNDFAFQLTGQEFTNSRSQIATSSLRSQFATSKRGGPRYLPWVFTEHGAIMLASVLNSSIAIDASVRVVRAFVKLREMVSSNVQLATKLAELERRLDSHDSAIAQLFAAIRQLLAPPEKPKREIGFHVCENGALYRARRRRPSRKRRPETENR